MKPITVELAKSAIENSNGKIFSVKFVKKDGTVRDMVCRLGVKKHIKGVGLNYSPEVYDLVVVFDMQKRSYRMINLSSIKTITINSKDYKVIQ